MRRGGQEGMFAAVLLYWCIGFGVCFMSLRIARVLVLGAFYLAWSQIFPILQVLAGFLAAVSWHEITGGPWPAQSGWQAEVSGFMITLLTANLLGIAAFCFGKGWTLLRRHPLEGQEEADFADDPNSLTPPDDPRPRSTNTPPPPT
jgi:hypothetical protein